MTADSSTKQYGPYGGLLKRIAELEAERDAFKVDAERYQKVRRMASCGELPREWTEGYTERELDSAIDAAKGE